MLGSILNGIQIKNEIPEAIGYRTYGPYKFPVPEELISSSDNEELNSLSDMSILYFDMNNYSSKVQREIRIIYSGDFQYSPKINFDSRKVDVDFEIKKNSKEICIKELLPQESISISFFNTDTKFEIEQVLIGDQMITSTMNALAELKRSPSFKWHYLFISVVLIFPLVTAGYAYNSINKSMEVKKLISESYKNLGYMQCAPDLFDNPVGSEKSLERKYQQLSKVQQENTLALNNVKTYDKLKVKDKVLFCLPKKS